MPPRLCHVRAGLGSAALSAVPSAAASTASTASTATAAASPPTITIPFALPQLHVGTDICSIARVHAILSKPSSPSPSSPSPSSSSPSSPSSPSPSPSSPPSPSTAPSNARRFIRRLLTPAELDALATSPGAPPLHRAIAALAGWPSSPPPPLPSSPPPPLPSSPPPPSPPLWPAATFLAARFAAKEAAIKAHPHVRGLTLQRVRLARAHDADLARNGSGPPVAYVQVPPPPSAAAAVYEQEARVSISHDGNFATAVCIGFTHAVF